MSNLQIKETVVEAIEQEMREQQNSNVCSSNAISTLSLALQNPAIARLIQ